MKIAMVKNEVNNTTDKNTVMQYWLRYSARGKSQFSCTGDTGGRNRRMESEFIERMRKFAFARNQNRFRGGMFLFFLS